MIDNYTYVIVALLPLAALILVFQVNPYQALVIRAILGAVAALVYAVLGAADVALTEALVGTMLAITLYVVAVRSSLVMRLGIVEQTQTETSFEEAIAHLRKIINKYHLRLEFVEYPNPQLLKSALMEKEVHAICTNDRLTIRVRRLFEIIQTEAHLPETSLSYITIPNSEEKH